MPTDQDDALHDEERRDGSDEARAAGDPDDGAGALRAELDRERARATELREQLMRTAADFDNFRKRTDRDRVEERKQAAAGLVRSLLPVLDGVGRALQSAQAAGGKTDLQGFVDGIRMIEVQLFDVLRQAGLERVDTTGGFDPVVHEALMQEASEEHPHLSILDVFEPGYRLGGKLLRPARVKVAHNPGGTGSGGDDESDRDDEADEPAEPGADADEQG